MQYLAAWDVLRGKVMGRCEEKTGTDSFGRLVDQVIRDRDSPFGQPCLLGSRHGSSHRGPEGDYATAEISPQGGHGPYAGACQDWLNQVEIYFSIIQRKVLTPNDFASFWRKSEQRTAVV